jgi:hypothetical protein
VSTSGVGNRVMTSPDGINWTIRASTEDNNWAGVCYGNGTFVAVSNSGTNRVMTNDYTANDNMLVLNGGVIYPRTTLFIGSALRSRNSSGTLTTPTVGSYSYMSCDTTNNTNWTSSYSGGNNSRLLVPVAGVYSVIFSLTPTATNQDCEFFISKNECNNNDLNVGGLLSTNSTTGKGSCLSTTVSMTTTDFISCGFYFGSGIAFTDSNMSSRGRLTLTLLQRTA